MAVGCVCLLLTSSQHAWAQDYFGKGEKQIAIAQEGDRSSDERTLLLSLFGGALLLGGVGTYYALDSQTLSNKVTATRAHTNTAWTQQLGDIHNDATRSAAIAKVSFGIGTGLLVAGIATYILTTPDENVSYTEVQARLGSMPSLTIVPDGGVFIQQSFSY